MQISLLVQGAPNATDAPTSALGFARAAVVSGHAIRRVFFYNEGVHIANRFVVAPQDEVNVADEWVALASDHGIELVVCIAAALRRGIVDAEEAKRYALSGATLRDGFEIVGLGQMVEAMLESDRVVTFA
ncbi:MAG: sulfurtransferase complex subunit TusD [Gammaproteobacteria bacterium]|nr:sulfurtransferase complex subunit TusD [Gammaproteobacteria bacterium]